MAYTDEGKIEKYLSIDIDSSMSAQVTDWIASVTKWINKYCGKVFESASETRYYDGNGRSRLLIDSFVGDPTTVQILNDDGSVNKTLTVGIGNDYQKYPLNETEKNELVLLPNSSQGNFPCGRSNIKVTAAFGYSTSVPEDVALCATKLVAAIIQKGLDGGKVSELSLGDYTSVFQTIDEAAEPLGIYNILDMYRDIDI